MWTMSGLSRAQFSVRGPPCRGRVANGSHHTARRRSAPQLQGHRLLCQYPLSGYRQRRQSLQLRRGCRALWPRSRRSWALQRHMRQRARRLRTAQRWRRWRRRRRRARPHPLQAQTSCVCSWRACASSLPLFAATLRSRRPAAATCWQRRCQLSQKARSSPHCRRRRAVRRRACLRPWIAWEALVASRPSLRAARARGHCRVAVRQLCGRMAAQSQSAHRTLAARTPPIL